jgi:CRP-like cAMP-binding protein
LRWELIVCAQWVARDHRGRAGGGETAAGLFRLDEGSHTISLTTQIDPTGALLGKVEKYLKLDQDEKQALIKLPLRIERVDAGSHTITDGDRPTRSQMVLSGILGTSKALANGRRQIAALHIKGDWPDLLSLHLGRMDSDLRALTPATVAFVEHDAIRKMCRLHPRLNDLFWKFTLIDAAIFRHWVVNVGQRAAEPRVAHLLCEHFARAEHMGLTDGNTCRFSLTQSDLADATGLSTVHLNRTIQSLRSRKLISWEQGTLTIHDRDALEGLADFWPDYLHLPSPIERI